jgi:hypothetical protein
VKKIIIILARRGMSPVTVYWARWEDGRVWFGGLSRAEAVGNLILKSALGWEIQIVDDPSITWIPEERSIGC